MSRLDIIPVEDVLTDIRRAKAHNANLPYGDKARMDPWDYRPDVSPALYLARMSRMADEGILDYGVSLRGAWIVADNH